MVPPPAEPPEPENENAGTGAEPGTGPVEEPPREPSQDSGEHGTGVNPAAGGEQHSDQAPEQAPEPAGSAPPPPVDTRRDARRATRTRLDGKHGAPSDHAVRGRRRRVVPVEVTGGRPDVVATLTAALPWQRHRRAQGGTGVVVRPEDLRGRIRRLRGGRLLVIVVDASGSMAQHMIRRAKAIALGELDRAYRERSTVCIVLARGTQAAIGLPPTRSTSRARDALRALPTGGGTPLASAFLLAARTASRCDPAQADVIVLTDGRANVGIGGDPRADAIRTARLVTDASRTVQLDLVARRGRAGTSEWLRQAFGTGGSPAPPFPSTADGRAAP
jgi:Mg-chelatase subunit ChlD